MARLTRKNLKVFADSATNNGVFGSFQAGNPTVTSDVETIQSLSAWGNGWNDATMTSKKLPPLQEFQAVQYVGSYQVAYILQEGVAEWDSNTTYYSGSWVKSNASGKWELYESTADNNTNNAVTDTTKWEVKPFDGGLAVGDYKTSSQTANHGNWFLCNGQAISRTTYNELFTLIGTTYGPGDGSTTFNLPDFTNIIQPTSSTVAIAGNGKTLGFTDGTNNYGLQVVAGDINTGMAAQKYGSDVGESWVNNPASAYKTVGITTDPTKSGIVGSIQNVQLNYFIKVK